MTEGEVMSEDLKVLEESDKIRVKELLDKCGRTKEDFDELISIRKKYPIREKRDEFKRDFLMRHSEVIIQYIEEYEKYKDIISAVITVSKNKKVSRDVSAFKPADEEQIRQVMGEEGWEDYKAKMELLKANVPKQSVKITTVEQEVPLNIYFNYDSGLWVSQAEVYKDFLYGDKRIYSFNKIASFLGFDLNLIDRGTKVRKDIYLVFLKNYSEMEYYTISDLFAELNSEEERSMWMSKKILTLEQVKKDIETGVHKVVEFSDIIDNIVKQIIPS
jgi:hypothetical protein